MKRKPVITCWHTVITKKQRTITSETLVSVSYTHLGIKGMITADVNYAGTLGGKNAYKTLAEYVGSINGKLFASAGITYMTVSYTHLKLPT